MNKLQQRLRAESDAKKRGFSFGMKKGRGYIKTLETMLWGFKGNDRLSCVREAQDFYYQHVFNKNL